MFQRCDFRYQFREREMTPLKEKRVRNIRLNWPPEREPELIGESDTVQFLTFLPAFDKCNVRVFIAPDLTSRSVSYRLIDQWIYRDCLDRFPF